MILSSKLVIQLFPLFRLKYQKPRPIFTSNDYSPPKFDQILSVFIQKVLLISLFPPFFVTIALFLSLFPTLCPSSALKLSLFTHLFLLIYPQTIQTQL